MSRFDSGECQHPGNCRLHEPEPKWTIDIGRRSFSPWWGIAALVVLIALSTIPGLN